jgi:hypothetical protein
MPVRHLLLAILLALAPRALASDNLAQRDGWQPLPSDGVEASVARDDDGALRLDFDFTAGAGFVILQLPLDLPLPEHFAVEMTIKASAQPNNLELKLLAPERDDGQDVWWHNRWGYRFPGEWTTLRSKRRHFEYAWGPSGGDEPLTRLDAIELAIAAGEGGEGTLWLRNLTIHELDAPRPYGGTRTLVDRAKGMTWWSADDEPIGWTASDAELPATLEIDFGVERPIDGLELRWAGDGTPSAYGLTLNNAALISAQERTGGVDVFHLPDADVRSLVITVRGAGHTLENVSVISAGEMPDANAYIARVATHARRGLFPAPFVGEQAFWTVVGAPDSDHELTISEHGAIEPLRGGPIFEPFIRLDDRLISWADVQTTQALEQSGLPIPTVRWASDRIALEILAVPWGASGEEFAWRYRLSNTSDGPISAQLVVVLRPFQNLPPWQRLNLVGGVAHLPPVTIRNAAFLLDRLVIAEASERPARSHVMSLQGGDIIPLIDRRAPFQAERGVAVTNALSLVSGAMVFDVVLVPGEHHDIAFATRSHPSPVTPDQLQQRLGQAAQEWQTRLNHVTFEGPPQAQRAWNIVRSNLAYILINADGPALQPGSRTYERSWIRDGAVTGAALLSLGHTDRVADFLEWYAPYQFENGKVPCVVDKRGPDPVDEHDSTGQLIYLLRRHADVTGDTSLLERHFGRVVKGIEYLEGLRAQRMVSPYDRAHDPERVKFGILPESISHEGYSAKPMHSYWDNFWALRGIKDAAAIAERLGKPGLAAEWSALAGDFRRTLYDSIRLAAQQHNIAYIPGCAELGDFDPTSTATAIMPGGELDHLPPGMLAATFARWWAHAKGRMDDTVEWFDYTPYEARIIGALVMMGQADRAHELMAWLFEDILPAGWNHWAEVAYRDDHHPGWIGDMPHTWVGAGFINSFLTMLAYERESDDALVLAAGVPLGWLEGGQTVGIRNLRTAHGPLSYRLVREGGSLILAVEDGVRTPPGGLAFRVPGDAGLARVTVNGAPRAVREGREITFHETPAIIAVRLDED